MTVSTVYFQLGCLEGKDRNLSKHMLLSLVFLVFVFILVTPWQIPVEYGTTEEGKFSPLGIIYAERLYDGNFTGRFEASASADSVFEALKRSIDHDGLYIVRTTSGGSIIQGYNEPCLMTRASLMHDFRVGIDADRQIVLSLSVYPKNLYVAGKDYRKCDATILEKPRMIHGSVVLSSFGELPSPDTISYIKKLEKEKLTRQQGAQQDNRSFIQKYWMYIAVAIVFMVISNAAASEQGAE
ncbi:hypothetical protein AB6A40_008932 [Gnathostoma spinigerum]|uniref:ER membrane protein complex subunit 10 n=1 Tax=Gnathostoma spinigerum TaxID=75299 RepID=A0ABD6EQJ9_9BILA